VTFGANDSPNGIASTLAVGMRYRYSAWVRSAANVGKVKLRVREFDGINQVGSNQYSSAITLSPSWKSLTLDFLPMQLGTSLDFQILDSPVAPAEVFLVDQVSITIVAPAASALKDSTGRDASPVASAASKAELIDDALLLGPPLRALITPHPVVGEASLRFATSRPGPLRVELLDIHGRRVSTLLDEANAAAGLHRVWVAPHGNHGERFAPGIFFWRIDAAEGTRSGRIVVLE
jgi:hypothetical protein